MRDLTLYSNDINLLSYWQKCFPNARILDSIDEIYKMEEVILIIDYNSLALDVMTFLKDLKGDGHYVFVLDRMPDLCIAKMLISYGAYGYGNALMKLNALEYAIEVISDGFVWLHPEFTSALILEIPQTQEDVLDEKLQLLTQREKEVALLLKEGMTYKNIAQHLAITPRTVKAHANNIYTKLKLKDRLALALYLR